ncbi:oxidative stress-induced growth inhibitor 1-like [Babylonia areolata]|uniref:oxidative stress-induced growth inhibitor 1-like n=1 Tax=Babylonia areolata TaxID=304850 RepID=UPI003FCFA3D3
MASNTTCRWKERDNYRDVVVVGNGPSAITLSFLLHGHRPYYNGDSHSNALLTSKLKGSKESSLVEQDLEFLSEGLEGRSPNPVALLWDALMHPDADLGADSTPLLSWEYHPSKAFSHVVLGKMKAGGSWQRMEGAMQTLSQSNWMELPDLPFRQWLAKRHRRLALSSRRATTGDVRDYYEDYVSSKGLRDHFQDYHVVTSIQKAFHTRNGADSESGEVEPCCQNIRENHHFLWEVRGYRIISHPSSRGESSGRNGDESEEEEEETDEGCLDSSVEDLSDAMGDLFQMVEREEFCYVTPNVVLATGTYDIPNRLGVRGESFPSVIHSLSAFEEHLTRGDLTCTSAPICVVGAGLSAADAILMALEIGLPVLHVFRCGPKDPNLIFRKLPQSIYPEYHRVAMLMKGEEEHELYQAYPRHRVVEIGEEMVLLKPIQPSSSFSPPTRSPSPPGSEQSLIPVDVSCAVIMVGSRPDLSFLPGGGRNLGIVSKWPIDSKHNPIDVNPYSYQSTHERGLFAMGPLIGDNFVRFGIGGALGIVSHLVSEEEDGSSV